MHCVKLIKLHLCFILHFVQGVQFTNGVDHVGVTTVLYPDDSLLQNHVASCYLFPTTPCSLLPTASQASLSHLNPGTFLLDSCGPLSTYRLEADCIAFLTSAPRFAQVICVHCMLVILPRRLGYCISRNESPPCKMC